ncbi:hypothetical protein NDA11_007212 [Ustilago hordei]|uniref:Palmitoyltransferase n=1 Tax=Ustilago hordei TaxID=120017 RepID=I2FQW7_USTHO|nr:uncharacterized protein UHO2_05122 [Ustilago hordei]KAJ1571334.1 hypothetical protein NDA12_006931 [Ustilago hordei]KAJ1571603.1 hypothetical protein NDA15_007653 [Ustilago hordei]KAJ1596161.1 hypothetical protein NDA11_007212 [Ustilago hordei]KAJ1596616.1 hypothetical protein NDA14_001906 [Ustilago hordei]CCF49310.1 uncharacterized protein UHOR_07730 [Ustilago hordei]
MSASAPNDGGAPQRPGSVEPTLAESSAFPSSRTLNSASRASFYTEAMTRRSSFQSAQASLYHDTEGSVHFTDAHDDLSLQHDLDSDLEAPSQRTPSRAAHRPRSASPFDYARPASAASITDPSTTTAATRLSSQMQQSGDRDESETTVDAPAPTLGRRPSSQRQSIQINRPLSSMSRRSSTSEDPQHRLRDAATAAARRSSMSHRRHSQQIDQLANSISRASTPHGFRSDENEHHATSQPRSRSGSSLALRKYEQDAESFIKRDATKDRGSILPPAGFFAPKKPSARNSTGNLLAAAAATTSPQAGRSTTPLSFYSNGPSVAEQDKRDRQAREEILDLERSTLPTGQDQQAAGTAPSPSPWSVAASLHSVNSTSQHATAGYRVNLSDRNYTQGPNDANVPRSPLDPSDGFPTPSAQPSPHSVVRMMASTDPLLPARTISNAAVNGAPAAGLGFQPSPTLQPKLRANGVSNDQRASLPDKRRSATQKANGTTNVDIPSEPKAQKAQRGRRNYRNHEGENRFFLGGLLMTSSDNPLPFILSYFLLLVLGGLFFGFEAVWLSANISPALIAIFAYIWLLAVVNMGVTAFRDPGIIPRGLDPDPPCVLGNSTYESGRQSLADPEDPLATPIQRVLRIRNQTVKVKWCETCGTYRPPRSSHCRVCDNCVENIDHHCTYLNTCIGRRNYVSFMVFLLTSILSALWVVGCTATRMVLLTRPSTYRYPRAKGDVVGRGLSFREALANTPVSAVLFLLCIGAILPLIVLFIYHVRLVLLNRSTVEQIRINTARDYGEHKELELGTHEDDAASTYGAAETNRRGRGRGGGIVRALFERFGIMKPKYKDPNPFASRSTRTNVRNALGWRSVMLESWIDRRAVEEVDGRLPHPRVAYKSQGQDA